MEKKRKIIYRRRVKAEDSKGRAQKFSRANSNLKCIRIYNIWYIFQNMLKHIQHY